MRGKKDLLQGPGVGRYTPGPILIKQEAAMITNNNEFTMPVSGSCTRDQLKAMVLELTDEERRELLALLNKSRRTGT